jgi:hypothetical protein
MASSTTLISLCFYNKGGWASSNTVESLGGRQVAIPQNARAKGCRPSCGDMATCVTHDVASGIVLYVMPVALFQRLLTSGSRMILALRLEGIQPVYRKWVYIFSIHIQEYTIV